MSKTTEKSHNSPATLSHMYFGTPTPNTHTHKTVHPHTHKIQHSPISLQPLRAKCVGNRYGHKQLDSNSKAIS